MEMHQVRYFMAASGTLNFTRAAEQCNVSQPALTTAIKKLESELGAQLFHREGKRILLTEFGQTMRPHLEQILDQTDVAQTAAQNFRLLNKVPVRLGVLPTIGPLRFAQALATFQAKHPGVEVAVREGKLDEMVALLEEGDLDLAVFERRFFPLSVGICLGSRLFFSSRQDSLRLDPRLPHHLASRR